MPRFSMSVSAGPPNHRHNVDEAYRAGLPNVIAENTFLNKILADETPEDAYKRLFGAALDAYNEKQRAKKHPERCIDDYFEHIENAFRNDARKVQEGKKARTNTTAPLYEVVLQIGSAEDAAALKCREGRKRVNDAYERAYETIKERTAGALEITQAVVHWDEATPHMHVEFVAYGEGNKRGLERQASLNQALKELARRGSIAAARQGKGKIESSGMPGLYNMMMRCLEDAAAEQGIERTVVGCERGHMDVRAYKQAMRDAQEVEQHVDAEKSKAKELEAEAARLDEQVKGLDKSIAGKQAEAARLDTLIEKAKALLDRLEAKVDRLAAWFRATRRRPPRTEPYEAEAIAYARARSEQDIADMAADQRFVEERSLSYGYQRGYQGQEVGQVDEDHQGRLGDGR